MKIKLFKSFIFGLQSLSVAMLVSLSASGSAIGAANSSAIIAADNGLHVQNEVSEKSGKRVMSDLSAKSEISDLSDLSAKSEKSERSGIVFDTLVGGVVRFAYLADLHVSDVQANVEDLERSVADINGLADVQFVILGGDITEFGSDREIELAKSILDRLNKPYFIVAGNHDAKWSESGCNTFAKVFGYEFFDFEAGGIRFLGSNSGPNMRMAPALVPRETILMLDSISKNIPQGKPVIFVNHYPLDSSMLNWFEVIDILKRTNIQFALCGHGHNNRVLDYEGVTGVMGRSNLRAGRDGNGFNIVTINVKTGMVDFAERSAGKTKQPWFRIKTNINESSKSNCCAKPKCDNASCKCDSHNKEMSKSSCKCDSHKNNQPMNASLTQRVQFGPQMLSGSNGSALLLPKNETPVLLMSLQDNTDIGSAAVEVAGTVIYANTAGVVKAVRAADGSAIWSFKTGGKIFSSPAVEYSKTQAKVVVGSSDGFIYCLDFASGREIWRHKAQKSVLASPVIYKGIVYIGASDGVFRAIHLKSGKLKWSFDQVKGFVESRALVDDSGVYFGSWGSEFYALDRQSGRLKWTWTNGKGRGYSPAAVWPVKSGGVIYLVTPQRMTHAIDASSGAELWSAPGGRESISLANIYLKNNSVGVVGGARATAVADARATAVAPAQHAFSIGVVATPGGSRAVAGSTLQPVVYVKAMWDTVFAYKALPISHYTSKNLELAHAGAYSKNLEHAAESSKGIAHAEKSSKELELAHAGASSKNLEHALASKSLLWAADAGYGYEISPTPMSYADGILFVPTDKGDIFALDAATGQQLWRYKFAIALINNIQPIGQRRILVSSMDGKVGIIKY